MTDSPDVSRPSPEVTPPAPAPAVAQGPIPASPSPEPSTGGLQRLWTLVVRLLILGMGVSLGWISGLLVAQVWPSRHPTPPLQERVMRQTSQTLRKVRQLPQWWQGSEVAMNPANPSSSEPPTAPNEAPAPETDLAASRLDQEVTSLQRDLANLENRLADLEQQTGQAGTGRFEERLQQVAEAVASGAATEATAPTAEETAAATESTPAEEEPAPSSNADPANDGLGRHAAAPFQDPPFSLVSDRISLPGTLLFVPGSSLLTPTGRQWLDTIVPDLRRFGAVTVLVGSHTDGDLSAEDARTLTFQQALAVQTYLAPQLEDTNGRWLAVGYGKTRPLAVGDDPGAETRNQRLEIGIIRP
ncbi:MAG: OmpA family protein [Leptolyngbya sp.]|nr:OmpA family protein [Leptolyngbya sp.]